MLRNRHPADALADVRAEIKQLQIREAELRDELLRTTDRRGLEWEAWVQNCNQERLDVKTAKKYFDKDVLKPFLRQVSTKNVRLRRARKTDQNHPKTATPVLVASVTQKDTLR
jgi:hypothetical protein